MRTRLGAGIPAANMGAISGPVLQVNGVDDVLDLLEVEDSAFAGAIALVTDAGATFLAPIFSELAGLICLNGATGSHLAIVSRDFGKPALLSVEFEGAMPVTGEIVTIDTESGSVYGAEVS